MKIIIMADTGCMTVTANDNWQKDGRLITTNEQRNLGTFDSIDTVKEAIAILTEVSFRQDPNAVKLDGPK